MTDVQARWARALMDALACAGLRDVVVSPGSRSTPFVLAAAAHPDLASHEVLDERSAAFFALGQARFTGRPSALLCTSGTAAAHYMPAVIEASQAFVPLVVLSADRPFELAHCGANQTIDQAKLFGSFVRHFADVGMPNGSPRALLALRRTAVQAVAIACGPEPGPVHLDLHATKPLEPEPEPEAQVGEAAHPEPTPGAVTAVHTPRPMPTRDATRALAALLGSTPRGVIVAGPAPLAQAEAREAVHALARRVGWPLCAEATSQLRLAPGDAPRCDGFDWLFRTEVGRAQLAPRAVLQLGAAPTSTGFGQVAAAAGVRRAVVAPVGWPDPTSNAALLVRADVGATVRAVLEALGPGTADGAWARELGEADHAVWRAVGAELGRGDDALDEARVTDAVARACDGRAVLMVGNSLPVRHLDAWVPGGALDVPVASQRGASGIDGLVSGAAGLAHRAERPTVLLVGDVSFLHDVNGLLAARHVRTPLSVVVLNNGGGRIFEQLPLGDRADLARHMPLFTTPHGAALAHAAALYGHAHVRVDTRTSLREALGAALGRGGTTVIEAVVPEGGAREQRLRVAAALEAALSRETTRRGT